MNESVFTEDGWFETGDLGFLRNGRLTITGTVRKMQLSLTALIITVMQLSLQLKNYLKLKLLILLLALSV
nr:hypothetical protein P5621_09680 [Bacillus subtilis]